VEKGGVCGNLLLNNPASWIFYTTTLNGEQYTDMGTASSKASGPPKRTVDEIIDHLGRGCGDPLAVRKSYDLRIYAFFYPYTRTSFSHMSTPSRASSSPRC
jgi:hypothetical protein